MKRVLVFGDTHIPKRRDSIPLAFFEHIRTNNYDLALITGDLVRESDMRKAMPPLPKCVIVRGNMDLETKHYLQELIQIDDFCILLLHGTQVDPRGNLAQLGEIAREANADVTVHGHTHEEAIDLLEGRLFLNPGTISGSTGGWAGRVDASFMELVVSSGRMGVTLYHTDWADIRKSETAYLKTSEGISKA